MRNNRHSRLRRLIAIAPAAKEQQSEWNKARHIRGELNRRCYGGAFVEMVI